MMRDAVDGVVAGGGGGSHTHAADGRVYPTE